VKYVVALGSNLGDRESILHSAIESIRSFSDIKAVSSFYDTAPVGGPDQPNYLNAVLITFAELSPEVFLSKLQDIENSAGRTREVRWGARTLDLDVITAGGVIQESEFLTLPHPRAHERTFVLAPWLEIEPEAELPGLGSAQSLFAGLSSQE
jgi:2-amino-4-hydroxy-6-hydroxymethyldihydropteridine diphosphokinase